MIDSFVTTLKNKGFEMPEILNAIHTAEVSGEANLNGYVIRHNDRGEMIALHPSWCGIYVGDYNSHIVFQRNLSYTCNKYGFSNAKHRDLPQILEKLSSHKTNGFILCECLACNFSRYKKQVEKLGYTVHKSNISSCDSDISTCVFLIA